MIRKFFFTEKTMTRLYLIEVTLLLTITVTSGQLLSLPKQQTCSQDSDCASNECCGIATGPFIVSRRQVSSLSGTCKPYLQLNDWCYGQWKQNGDCGCAHTMTCKYFPPSTSAPLHAVGKRHPAPGQYLCKSSLEI